MRRLLHILTKPDDDVAETIIAAHRQGTGLKVTVVDLTKSEPDYPALLEEIFAADSIQVW